MENGMPEPKLELASFEFSQDGNCVDKNEYEVINIEFKSDLGLDNTNGGFYVIKTDAWSIDSIEDLQKLIDRINKILK